MGVRPTNTERGQRYGGPDRPPANPIEATRARIAADQRFNSADPRARRQAIVDLLDSRQEREKGRLEPPLHQVRAALYQHYASAANPTHRRLGYTSQGDFHEALNLIRQRAARTANAPP